jgi:hypothetical protein
MEKYRFIPNPIEVERKPISVEPITHAASKIKFGTLMAGQNEDIAFTQG